MSENEHIFLAEIKTLGRKILIQVIIGTAIALILAIGGGGLVMAKVFNVKGKTSKEYVDGYVSKGMLLMEERNNLLEEKIELQKDEASTNSAQIEHINEALREQRKRWDEHMNFHMEKTRGMTSQSQ
jgi:hypothetical protein